jgi:hypothetical protein
MNLFSACCWQRFLLSLRSTPLEFVRDPENAFQLLSLPLAAQAGLAAFASS